MILSEQEKNRIRGLHREGSIIKEQQGPPGPGGYVGGTPCYACIGNHIVTMLFPSSALGQPYPDCAPTAYGYQGQANGLPGGSASYGYPSIWSEVQPTNCGTGSGGNTTGSCNKDCSQLVPSGFAGNIANKPCNWLSNRESAFTNKLTTLTQGSCQYKRVECKLKMVHTRKIQSGC